MWAWPPRRPRGRRWCEGRGRAGPWNSAVKPRRAKWAWISTRSGVGRGGTRPSTRAMGALALLTVLRAGASAVETFKTRLPSPPAHSRLAGCKASRGLASRCAYPKFVGSCGAWSSRSSRRSSTSWRGRGGAAGLNTSPGLITTNVGERWLRSSLHTYHCSSRRCPRSGGCVSL